MVSPNKNYWKANEPPKKRPHSGGHENVTVKLAELAQKIDSVAYKAHQNSMRIEANEKNSRALNIILKPFPKKDAEGNFIEPMNHLRAILSVAYEFDTQQCDQVINDVAKIHYLYGNDNAASSFIVRFLRQSSLDAMTKNAKKLHGYTPHGNVISLEHDLTKKQRTEKGVLLRALKVLKDEQKEAKLVYGGNAGYLLLLNGIKYGAGSQVVLDLIAKAKPNNLLTHIVYCHLVSHCLVACLKKMLCSKYF